MRPRRVPTPEGLWTCSACRRALPREAFYRLAEHYHTSGLTSQCRECTARAQRERRAYHAKMKVRKGSVMTPERLRELERLCAEATPGPWADCREGTCRWVLVAPSAHPTMTQRVGTMVHGRDAVFAVVARAAIPELLAALREEHERAEAAERQARDWQESAQRMERGMTRAESERDAERERCALVCECRAVELHESEQKEHDEALACAAAIREGREP